MNMFRGKRRCGSKWLLAVGFTLLGAGIILMVGGGLSVMGDPGPSGGGNEQPAWVRPVAVGSLALIIVGVTCVLLAQARDQANRRVCPRKKGLQNNDSSDTGVHQDRSEGY